MAKKLKQNAKQAGLERLVKLYFDVAPMPPDKLAYTLEPQFWETKDSKGKPVSMVRVFLADRDLVRRHSLEQSSPVSVSLPLQTVVASLPGKEFPAPYLHTHILSLLDAGLFQKFTQPGVSPAEIDALVKNRCGVDADGNVQPVSPTVVIGESGPIIGGAVNSALYALRHRLDGAEQSLSMQGCSSVEQAVEFLREHRSDKDGEFDSDAANLALGEKFTKDNHIVVSVLDLDVEAEHPLVAASIVPFQVLLFSPRVIAGHLARGAMQMIEQLT